MDRKTDAEGNQSTEAEISIYDSIGGFGISANEFIDELKGLGDVETINLRIASARSQHRWHPSSQWPATRSTWQPMRC
jgi:hypothetical protein